MRKITIRGKRGPLSRDFKVQVTSATRVPGPVSDVILNKALGLRITNMPREIWEAGQFFILGKLTRMMSIYGNVPAPLTVEYLEGLVETATSFWEQGK